MSRFILAMLLVGLTTVSARAAATPNIATINLSKVFDSYYKTKQATGVIKDRAADMDKEFKSLVADFEKAKDDYQKIRASSEDTAVSADERDKRKRASEDKLKGLKEQEDLINQYRRTASSNLEEQKTRMTDRILGEIREVINARAKAGSYTLVLDTGIENTSRAPVVLYTNGDSDLTNDVIEQLNAGAPAPTADTIKPVEQPLEKKGDKKK